MNIINTLKSKLFFHKQEDKWDAGLRWILLFLVFLLPIFFFSPNTHPLEFDKVLLFCIIIFLITAVSYGVSLYKGTYGWIRTPFDYLFIIFFGFYLSSFIFSKDHYQSLVGVSGYYSTGLMAVLALILFIYLLFRLIKKKQHIFLFLYAFIASAILVVIYNLFKVFGVDILPWAVTKTPGFGLASSSAVSLAIYAGLIMLVCSGLMLILKKFWQKSLFGIIGLLSLFLLFLINKQISLFAVALGFFCLLILAAFNSRKISPWWVITPTILLTLLIVFIFIDVSSIFSLQVNDSIFLDQKTSANIAWQTVSHEILWGVGPQNYNYAFNAYRPVSFNNSDLWNLKFIKGADEWWGILTTFGLGGFLALLAICLKYLLSGIKSVSKLSHSLEDWSLGIVLLCGWLVTFIASWLLPFDFILWLAWALFLGLGMRYLILQDNTAQIIKINKTRISNLLFHIGFVVISTGAILVAFFGVKIWLADYHYVLALRGIDAKNDMTKIQQHLDKAIKNNPYEVQYYITQAQGDVTQAQLESVKDTPKTDVVQKYTQQAIDSLKKAKEVRPRLATLYEQEANLYDSMRNLISNADELSIGAYVKLSELEPNNPLVFLNLGRSRMLWGQVLQRSDDTAVKNEGMGLLQQSLVDFSKAKALKDNFIIADLNIGLAQEAVGNADEALKIYENIIVQAPDYPDAYWYAVLIYENKEDKDEAVSLLQKLVKIAPSNPAFKQKLQDLTSAEQQSDTAN
ncbi:MAG: tetratricopeptide repeat protein [Patescibacteria group bacterium]|jgi:tetratricopeptide (TPR) repeat protein